MSAHCKRLADLNTQSATVVRELAAYHEDALAASASTPAEHRALEEYFLTLAKRYTAEANAHTTMAQTYRGTRMAQAAVHHDRLAALARDSAKEANEAAARHKQLAGIAR